MSSSAERRDAEAARRRQTVAVLVAVAAHGLLLLGASRLHDAASVRDAQILVDIVDPPASAPLPEQLLRLDETVKHSTPPRGHGSPRWQAKPSETPPSAKREASPDEDQRAGVPLDLTGEMPVIGTSGRGSGTPAADGDRFGSGRGNFGKPGMTSEGRGSGPDLSTKVSLEGQSWSCPWPSEADSERIDEQTVIIRVVVDPDGSVRSAEIVVEPGHGFGKAAVTCALNTQFTPAHDRAGDAVRARSPPIRVRFTR
jgi:periplasmic protein TonB